MNTQVNRLRNTRLLAIMLFATALLMVPLVAMQFTNEVNWDLTDFIIAGMLLYGTGLACESVLRKVRSTKKRVLICAAILLALFLVWAELAVGIFGTPFGGS
jgi:hypothetical protein